MKPLTLLVNVPISVSGLGVQSAKDYMYPYSLVYLSNYLMKHDYPVEIIDLNMVPMKALEEYIIFNQPKYVGITGVTENRFLVQSIIIRARRLMNRKCKIIVGGRHFSHTGMEAMHAIPEIDIVVRGEGEIPLLEIVSDVPFDQIKGITYRTNEPLGSKIIMRNPDSIPHENLDDFAINVDFLPKGAYSPLMDLRNWEKEGIKAIPMQMGRGCTGSCIFCIHRFMKYRMRTLDSCIENIKVLKHIYNTEYFSFNDPSIYCNPNWMYDFCDRLLKEKIFITWYCEGRADIELDLLNRMSEAGCVSLDIGVETGSDRIQKVIRKYPRASMIEPVVEKAVRLGIRVKTFFMISHPEETEDDVMDTYDLAKKILPNIHKFGIGISEIFPGTELERIAKEKGLISDKFSWYDSTYNNNLPHSLANSRYDVIYLEKLSISFIEKMMKKYYWLNVEKTIDSGEFWKTLKSQSIGNLYQIMKRLI